MNEKINLFKGVNNKYGEKKAMLSYYFYIILYRFGWFRRFSKIDWSIVKRVVFVCRGNICRSPYAEVRAQQIGITASSYGLVAESNNEANVDAVRNAAACDVDLIHHRSRTFDDACIESGDLIVGMEPWHGESINESQLPNDVQVTLLGLWLKCKQPYIHDPYGCSDEYFRNCFNIIDIGVEILAEQLRN